MPFEGDERCHMVAAEQKLGVEAEKAKAALREHRKDVDGRRDLIADAMVERGFRYPGEKIKHQKPRPRRVKVPAVQELDRPGPLARDLICPGPRDLG